MRSESPPPSTSATNAASSSALLGAPERRWAPEGRLPAGRVKRRSTGGIGGLIRHLTHPTGEATEHRGHGGLAPSVHPWGGWKVGSVGSRRPLLRQFTRGAGGRSVVWGPEALCSVSSPVGRVEPGSGQLGNGKMGIEVAHRRSHPGRARTLLYRTVRTGTRGVGLSLLAHVREIGAPECAGLLIVTAAEQRIELLSQLARHALMCPYRAGALRSVSSPAWWATGATGGTGA